MTTTLITGANHGLGYETARQLLAAGHVVWMGAQDEAGGRAAADEPQGRFVALDVTSDESVAAAARLIAAEGGLDVLINNAGIRGPRKPVPDVTADDVRATYETNVFGRGAGHAGVHSPAPALGRWRDRQRLQRARLDQSSDRSCAHGVDLHVDRLPVVEAPNKPRRSDPIRVYAVDPGYTATGLNAHRGTQTVQEGSEMIVRMATIDRTEPTGTYVERYGIAAW